MTRTQMGGVICFATGVAFALLISFRWFAFMLMERLPDAEWLALTITATSTHTLNTKTGLDTLVLFSTGLMLAARYFRRKDQRSAIATASSTGAVLALSYLAALYPAALLSSRVSRATINPLDVVLETTLLGLGLSLTLVIIGRYFCRVTPPKTLWDASRRNFFLRNRAVRVLIATVAIRALAGFVLLLLTTFSDPFQHLILLDMPSVSVILILNKMTGWPGRIIDAADINYWMVSVVTWSLIGLALPIADQLVVNWRRNDNISQHATY